MENENSSIAHFCPKCGEPVLGDEDVLCGNCSGEEPNSDDNEENESRVQKVIPLKKVSKPKKVRKVKKIRKVKKSKNSVLIHNQTIMVEIARSFAYKLNIGNYQSADFFCSQKREMPINQADEISRELYEFCKNQVESDVARYIEENKPESEKVIDVSEPVDFPKKTPKSDSTTYEEHLKDIKQ